MSTISKIAIIGAMDCEINNIKKEITDLEEQNYADLKIFTGIINNKFIILAQSGVGKVNAALNTQYIIDTYKPNIIINTGVAGGIADGLDVGDIVIGTYLVQHDFDVTPFNYKKGQIPNVGIFIESDEYLIKIAEKCLKKAKKGIIASGDIFVTESWMSEKINKKFNALCVEMEGASIAQVCYLSHIPFLVIRSISDVPNNKNVITYEEFVESSSKKIADGMNNIIKNIKV